MTLLGIFFSPEHLREEVIQNLQNKIIASNKNDLTYCARKDYYKNAIEEDLDAIESFKKVKKEEKENFKKLLKK